MIGASFKPTEVAMAAWLKLSGCALMLAIAVLYVALSGGSEIGLLGTDGPVYLMMAEHFAPHLPADGAHDIAAATSRFPPVYPMLLAWTGGAMDLWRAHLLTALCLLAALPLLYRFQRIHSVPALAAALSTALFALLPGSWLLQLSIQSEFLYLFWSALALLLMESGERQRRIDLIQLAALVVALAVLTRSAGIVLIIPLLIAAWRLQKARGLLIAAIALLPVALWQGLHHSRSGYAGAIIGLYHMIGPAGVLAALPVQLQALRTGFGENLVRQPGLMWLADSVAIITFACTLIRARHLRLDAVYILLGTGVILIWPFPQESRRFVWVLLPFLLMQPSLALIERRSQAGVVPASARHVAAGSCLILALLAGAGLTFLAARWRDAAAGHLIQARQYPGWYDAGAGEPRSMVEKKIALIEAAHAIAIEVPPTDCVISIRPELVAFFGHRIAIQPPSDSLDDPAFRAMLRSSGCHYVFSLFWVFSDRQSAFYPMDRVQAYSETVFLRSVPGDVPGTVLPVALLMHLH